MAATNEVVAAAQTPMIMWVYAAVIVLCLLSFRSWRGALCVIVPLVVVSGTRGDMHFYERVSFTCGGKLINSWALLYPVSERHIYDRVVEAVARTYQPGSGRTGECD